MSTLICGSIAFDSIMVFNGRFKDHILPDQVHVLNVSFLVPELRREFGGCAGNIAYNLKLLGGTPLPMATVGDDAQPYLERLDRLGIDRRYVCGIAGAMTAHGHVVTDMDDNQIWAFHPGAMSFSHTSEVPRDAGVRLGIVAPDGRDGMLSHAQQFAQAGIPFIFDPGQGLPMFSAQELDTFISQTQYLAVNDYEARLMQDKLGVPMHDVARRVKALIVTRGGEGSEIHVDGRLIRIPVARAHKTTDPTGCGDAYRAGLLFGIEHAMDWDTAGRLAAVMGALKIETSGGQNHQTDRDRIADRFHESFGYRPW